MSERRRLKKRRLERYGVRGDVNCPPTFDTAIQGRSAQPFATAWRKKW